MNTIQTSASYSANGAVAMKEGAAVQPGLQGASEWHGAGLDIVKASPLIGNSDSMVIFLASELDEDDFSAIVSSIECKDRLLIICEECHMKQCESAGINFIPDEFRNVKGLLKKIADWKTQNKKTLAGVIALDEEHHYAISKAIADEFTLQFYSPDTLNYTSNKYLQRIRLSQAGIPCPKFQLISGSTVNYEIGFPNVLKIMTGIASMYIYLNRDIEELRKNIQELSSLNNADGQNSILVPHMINSSEGNVVLDPTKNFVLEEYVPGNEYSCDFMVGKNSQVSVLRVIRKLTDGAHFAEFGGFYLFNPNAVEHPEFTTETLQGICKQAADALGVKTGVCMMDFKFFNGKIFVLETTIRPGISTFIELMAGIYKSTSINKLICQKLDMPVSTEIPKETGLVCYLYAPSEGMLKCFDTSRLENDCDNLGVMKVNKYFSAGETVRNAQCYKNRPVMVGYVLLKNVPYESISQKIELIEKATVIEVEPEGKTINTEAYLKPLGADKQPTCNESVLLAKVVANKVS